MTDAPAKAWRIVLDRIESDLMSGELGPGDRLPPPKLETPQERPSGLRGAFESQIEKRGGPPRGEGGGS